MVATFKQLQDENREWAQRNFGTRPADWPLLGLQEEAGELAHHWLKMEQGIRGTKEEHLSEIKDAIADISIFFMDFCSCMKWDMQEVLGVETCNGLQFEGVGSNPRKLIFQIGSSIGRLAEAFIDGDDFRCKSVCFLLFRRLGALCNTQEWVMQEIVEATWDKVKQRNWKANAVTGIDLAVGPDETVRQIVEVK